MNNSEAFIHRLIAEGRIDGFQYDKCYTLPFRQFQPDFYDAVGEAVLEPGNRPVTVTVDLHYDPDTEYDYATMASCSHDGTALFSLQLIQQIVERLVRVETYYTVAGCPLTVQGQDMTFHYAVGDFVIFDRFGESPDPSRPFLTQHTTVYLPIAYKLTYEEQVPKI